MISYNLLISFTVGWMLMDLARIGIHLFRYGGAYPELHAEARSMVMVLAFAICLVLLSWFYRHVTWSTR